MAAKSTIWIRSWVERFSRVEIPSGWTWTRNV